MTVNWIRPRYSEFPWNKPFECFDRILQPFSIEVLPRLDFDGAGLSRLLPGNTRIFIPHLPRTTLAEIIATVRSLKLAGFEPVPHIAARRIADSSELHTLIAALHEEKVQELLLIAGSREVSIGKYEHCHDLLESDAFRRFRFKRLLFAGHPEGHPRVNREQIENALLKKIRAVTQRGYDAAVVSQFCFNTQATSRWIERIRNAGMDAPIIIGLTGPVSPGVLFRYAALCGVSVSASQVIKQPLQMADIFFKGKPEIIIETLMKQPEIRAQINGFHLFPFGGIKKTIRWAEGFLKSEKPDESQSGC